MNYPISDISPESIIKSLNANGKIYLSPDELKNILSFSEIIFEQNTLISDFIRILKIDDRIIVQEKTDKNEVALHLVKDEPEAKIFIDERLDIYEKMWDGCGCKVKYYD
ncbi:MAG TPA: hypothetical protein VLB50_04455 [Ignavibacteriaceae bacterium]|nr:hypothetical protein [Ignavibacteriaceae bacterium]